MSDPKNSTKDQVKASLDLLGTDSKLAQEQLETLHNQNPNNVDVNLALAFTYARFHHYEKANEMMRDALKHVPNLPEAYFNIGYNEWQLGHLEEAKINLNKAFQMGKSKNSIFGLIFSIFLHHTGKQQQAYKTLQQLEKLFPTDPRVAILILHHAKKTGDIKTILKHLKPLNNAIKTNPQVIFDTLKFLTLYDFPGWQNFDNKGEFINIVNRHKSNKDIQSSFFPAAFNLPDEKSEFLNTQSKYPLWISKKHMSSAGQGTYIFKNSDEINFDEPMIAQQYIHNPLLLNGHKFNLRAFVIITSLDPLRAYLWNDGIVFICPKEFDTNGTSLHQLERHIANAQFCTNDPNLYLAKNMDEENKSHLRHFSTLLSQAKEYGLDAKLIQGNLLKLATSALKLMKSEINSDLPAFPFKLIALDIVFDENSLPSIVEIERYPSLSSDKEENIVSFTIKNELLLECAKLLLPKIESFNHSDWKQHLLDMEKSAITNCSLLDLD